MSDHKRSLEIEAEAARGLMLNIRAVIGDDEEAVHDAIEGETNLIETIGSAVDRVAELEAHADALKARIDDLKARKERLSNQAEHIRTALVVAMGVADLKKLELPQATISRRPTPVTVSLINEADIPSRFWKPADPKLDKKAVLEALKAKEVVPGATLSNGCETVSIRFS
jgi:hypothetical protein